MNGFRGGVMDTFHVFICCFFSFKKIKFSLKLLSFLHRCTMHVLCAPKKPCFRKQKIQLSTKHEALKLSKTCKNETLF